MDENEYFFSLYGAWIDDRDSDSIIADIISSRINSRDISFD